MPYPCILYINEHTKCTRKLVKYLKKKNYQFSVVDYNSDESRIALKYHGHARTAAPILQLGVMFFHSRNLFDANTLKLVEHAKRSLKDLALRTESHQYGIQTDNPFNIAECG